MATTPLFVGSAFATPCVSFTTVSTDRTGAGTYATLIVGAPSLLTGIRFRAITQTIDTKLLIFHDDGTNVKLIDELGIYVANPAQAAWVGLWTPPNGEMLLASADEIMAAIYSGSMTIHSHALGGNL